MALPRQSSIPIDHGISVQSMGSASAGNAFLITSGTQVMLIDCGVGIRTIQATLRQRNIAMSDITTLCVTHEHSDHIRTLPKVLHENMTLFATRGTSRYLPRGHQNLVHALAWQPEKFGNITVWPLAVAHDAAEPTGFLLEFPDGSRATLLTDLGHFTDDLAEYVAGSDLIILESNYDEEMLRTGPYPIYLKRRVKSERGHLSNVDCGAALAATLKMTSRNPVIRLAHLSDHNNLPPLAQTTVADTLHRADLDFDVKPLPRTMPFEIWRPSGVRVEASLAAPIQPRGQMRLDLGF